ncbi:hypothetical protein B0H10DRAFT_2049363 [Mycena sp. CBHHK59/15]|nr:hypothetical protein B0H10DRAFT_2049363 [Mycena sp. CBHHK59/15]
MLASTSPQGPPAHTTPSPRRRKTSVFSLSVASSSRVKLDLPKANASVFLTVRTGPHNVAGAFSPTPDAAASLQFLVAPYSASVTRARRRSPARPPMPSAWSAPAASQAASPAPTIPSISRTASSFSVSSATSPTSSTAASLLDFSILPARRPLADADELDPALAALEKCSRFCATRVQCSTCRKPGTNYPACPRCGLRFCSRPCRLQGATRHVCPPTQRTADYAVTS